MRDNDDYLVTLLSKIVYNPDNLDLRRSYAEAIERIDPERAEFIRLQLDIEANLDPVDPDPSTEMRMKLHQIRQLLSAHGEGWASAISPYLTSHVFRRGFIELVELHPISFIDYGDRLLERAPIQHLDVSPWNTSSGEVFFATAALSKIKSLKLAGNGLDDDSVGMLSQSRYVSGIRYLDLGTNPITERGVRLLAESTALSALRWVNLRGTHFPATDSVFVYEDFSVSLPIVSLESRQIENELGRRLPWLHYPQPPTSVWDQVPDRWRL